MTPQLTAVLIFTVVSATIAQAQPRAEQLCHLHFAVRERNASESSPAKKAGVGITQRALRRFGSWDSVEAASLQEKKNWPAAAQRWWEKDGKRKFPELCEATSNQADVTLLWESTWKTERILESVVRRETKSIPQQSCDPPDQNGNTRCTTYEIQKEYDVFDFQDGGERQVEQMFVVITPLQKDKTIFSKTIVKTGHSFWGKPPAKSAFESTMKYLRKQMDTQIGRADRKQQ